MRKQMRPRLAGLWRHPDFLKLWTGQTISVFGSGITGNALPLAALLTLGASSLQMGLLSAAGSAPVLLVGLVAGVWVDRLRRRPLLIAADLGRALLLGSIPVAALLGQLRLEHLFVVAPLAGVLTVIFDVAYQSFVPSLVRREQIVEANSKLSVSGSLAEITTPGLAGTLVQVVSAPLVILIDAVSFVVSAAFLGAIRTPEPPLAPAAQRQGLGHEIGEGLRFVLRDPVLRAFAGQAATQGFFGSFIGALYALYAIRELGIGPALMGLSIGLGGLSNLVGALLVERVTRRFGIGPTLLGAQVVIGLSTLLIPLAAGPLWVATALLMASQSSDAAWSIYEINALSVRQSVTPPALLGRVNASMQLLGAGLGPLGAVAGGLLAELIGARTTLGIASAGIILGALWLVFSPVDRLREPPAPTAAAGT
jgi:MFS family permease